jgi:hypothetical protein
MEKSAEVTYLKVTCPALLKTPSVEKTCFYNCPELPYYRQFCNLLQIYLDFRRPKKPTKI